MEQFQVGSPESGNARQSLGILSKIGVSFMSVSVDRSVYVHVNVMLANAAHCCLLDIIWIFRHHTCKQKCFDGFPAYDLIFHAHHPLIHHPCTVLFR